MQPRPWHANYPDGVPFEIDADSQVSLAGLCLASCRTYADRIAISCQGVSLSFADIDRLSRDFAAFLSGVLKLDKGDRLAVMLPNLPQSAIVLLGALRAGMVVVNVNPLYTARELEHQLKDSGVRAVVVLENFAATLAKALSETSVEHVIVSSVGDCMPPVRRWLTNLVVRHVKRLVPAFHISDAISLPESLRRGRSVDYSDPVIGPEDLAFLQ
jgi:long-chain acyl-CoA synthetase